LFWNRVREQVEIEIKYEGFLLRQHQEVEKFNRMESTPIPKDFCYEKVNSLSTEGREKLQSIRPRSLAQASRITGVSASDLAILLIYLTHNQRKKTNIVSRETP